MTATALQIKGQEARLAGDLTFATVASLYDRMDAQSRRGHMPSVIDLSEVGQIDSAGLALLLEWQSAFRKQQAARGGSESLIRIENPPEALIKIARLCDAEDYLLDVASGPGPGKTA